MTSAWPAQLLVLAKAPIPGLVKTRLCPPCSAEEAAELAASALADTLAAAGTVPVRRRVLVLAGAVSTPMPCGWEVVAQRGGGLAQRLAAAYQDAWVDLRQPLLLIGMDTPQVTARLLDRAVGALLQDGTDAVLGLATDGGWWAMGLRRPDAALLDGVPMSTPDTGRLQAQRLRGAGLRVQCLPVLTDVDTWATAVEVAGVAPGTRLAATVSRFAMAGVS